MSAGELRQNRRKYGPTTFFAATVNVFLGTMMAWMAQMSPPFLLLYLYSVPMLGIDVLVAAGLLALPGLAGQAGRGLLIGLLSVPLSAAAVWSASLITA